MKIGVSAPLTVATSEDADVRGVGRDVTHTVLFSQALLNTSYELIVRDNENSAAKAQEIAAEFTREGVAVVLGLPTSDEVHRSAPALASARIPAITSMATSPNLARYPNVFRTRPNDGHACAALAAHLQAMECKSVGTLSEDTAYAFDCTQQLIENGARAGIRFSGRTFPTHSRDIAAHVHELSGAGFDAIFISAQDEAGYYRILREVRREFGSIQVLGSAMPGSRKFLEMAGSEADGIVYVSEPSVADTLTPYGAEVLERFRAEYGAPETGDYAVALTFAAFFAVHAAAQAGRDMSDRLAAQQFADPVNGSFEFLNREISSNGDPGGKNRFANHKLKKIVGGVGVSLL